MDKDNFSGILRRLPYNARVNIGNDGNAVVGDTRLPGRPGNIVAQLVEHGQDLTVLDLADLVVAGVFRRLEASPEEGIVLRGEGGSRQRVEDVVALARSALRSKYEAAPTHQKGIALIVRTERQRLKAILEGQEHFVVEAFYADMVHVGGYYPGFVEERKNLPGQAIGFQVFVPLYNDEVRKPVDEARRTFDRQMPWPYVEQAIQRAREVEVAW